MAQPADCVHRSAARGTSTNTRNASLMTAGRTTLHHTPNARSRMGALPNVAEFHWWARIYAVAIPTPSARIQLPFPGGIGLVTRRL